MKGKISQQVTLKETLSKDASLLIGMMLKIDTQQFFTWFLVLFVNNGRLKSDKNMTIECCHFVKWTRNQAKNCL